MRSRQRWRTPGACGRQRAAARLRDGGVDARKRSDGRARDGGEDPGRLCDGDAAVGEAVTAVVLRGLAGGEGGDRRARELGGGSVRVVVVMVRGLVVVMVRVLVVVMVRVLVVVVVRVIVVVMIRVIVVVDVVVVVVTGTVGVVVGVGWRRSPPLVMMMPKELMHPHVHVRQQLEPQHPQQARQARPEPLMSRPPHPPRAQDDTRATPVRTSPPPGSLGSGAPAPVADPAARRSLSRCVESRLPVCCSPRARERTSRGSSARP